MSIHRVGRTCETLRNVFESARALVQGVLDVREAASNAARAQERAESGVTAVRDNIGEGLAALAQDRIVPALTVSKVKLMISLRLTLKLL